MGSGEETSHDRLLKRFVQRRDALLGYLRVLTRDNAAADDALQETFLVVVRKISEFDTTRDFDAWVRGIARNVARRVTQNLARRPQNIVPDLMAMIEQVYEDAVDEREDREMAALEYLNRCLGKLKMEQRQLLDLRYREGHSLEALGQRLGRTAGAVQVALSRLRRALWECVQRQQREVGNA